MMGFKTFMIKVYPKDKNPLGDLARDIKDDKDFPNLSTNKKEIQMYLDYANACDGAKTAFETAWKAYAAYKKSVEGYEERKTKKWE